MLRVAAGDSPHLPHSLPRHGMTAIHSDHGAHRCATGKSVHH